MLQLHLSVVVQYNGARYHSQIVLGKLSISWQIYQQKLPARRAPGVGEVLPRAPYKEVIRNYKVVFLLQFACEYFVQKGEGHVFIKNYKESISLYHSCAVS